MADAVFRHFKLNSFQGDHDWDDPGSYPFTFTLMADTWTPDLQNDLWLSDVIAHEVNASHRKALVNQHTEVNGDGVDLCADNPSKWTGSGAFRYVLVFLDTGTAGTSYLCRVFDLGSAQNLPGTFTLPSDKIVVAADATDSGTFRIFKINSQAGLYNWDLPGTWPFGITLMANTWTPDLQADEDMADVNAHEISGSRRALVNQRTELNGDGVDACADNPAKWTFGSQTVVRYALVYRDTGGDPNKFLCRVYDMGNTTVEVGEDFFFKFLNDQVVVRTP
jgi:hypothetical protein